MSPDAADNMTTTTRIGSAELFEKRDKVELAIMRLREFEPTQGYYLAFSGGKDSQCIYHLAVEAGVKFDAHYSVTTIDPPELVRFIKAHYPDVVWERPKVPFLIMITQKGFPTRFRRWCCEKMKEGGGSGRRVVTGIRWAESAKRKSRKMVEVCYKDSKKEYLHPIIDWTEQDVWDFIKSRNLSYCSLYDEGWKRIGCMFCPMQSAHDKHREAEKYPAFERVFRKAFHKLWELRGDRESFRRWASADECFEWWMSNDPLPDTEDGLFT